MNVYMRQHVLTCECIFFILTKTIFFKLVLFIYMPFQSGFVRQHLTREMPCLALCSFLAEILLNSFHKWSKLSNKFLLALFLGSDQVTVQYRQIRSTMTIQYRRIRSPVTVLYRQIRSTVTVPKSVIKIFPSSYSRICRIRKLGF